MVKRLLGVGVHAISILVLRRLVPLVLIKLCYYVWTIWLIGIIWVRLLLAKLNEGVKCQCIEVYPQLEKKKEH